MRFCAFILCAAISAAASAADYATYIGDTFPYSIAALTTDSAGNTYVAGSRIVDTRQIGVPPLGPQADLFVTKLDSSGNILQTVTLSGKGSDQANSIAIDSTGDIWVAGVTSSPDFPLRNPLQLSPGGSPPSTGFLTKIGPDGAILFSTYLGGTKGSSMLNAVAVDSAGNAYVTGLTYASDYPRTPGLPAGEAGEGPGGVAVAFFAKIAADGSKLVYAGGVAPGGRACSGGSSCFLSLLQASGDAIAVDPSGSAYIAGNTNGKGMPTTPGALQSDGIGAFVMKVNSSGAGLDYLTMLGSGNYFPGGLASAGETVNVIAVDAAGNAYMTGSTNDPNFPTTSGVLQPKFSTPGTVVSPFVPPPDAFVAKLNPTGTAMVWATFLGGKSADAGQSIAVDPSGEVWVAGTTSSSDFPGAGGSGGEFLVEFNNSGSELTYAARFPVNAIAASISLDSSGTLHAAGSTGIVSTVTPSLNSASRLFGIENAAGSDLSGRIAPGELISIYGQHFGVSNPASGTFNSAGFLPNTLAGVQVMVGGAPAPLLYVSDTQINAVVPMGLAPLDSAQVQVKAGGNSLPDFRAAIDATDPEVFLNSDGSAAAINQDGSVNSAAHPAPVGSIVSIWATGTGAYAATDGQQAASAQFTCACAIQGAEFSFEVTYAGTAPGMVNGVSQINFEIPADAAGSFETFSLSVGGRSSTVSEVYISR